MDFLLGPAGGALDAASQIAREHQSGDRREEVGGGTTVGGRPDLQKEVQDAGKPEAGRYGCWEHQETRLEVLPAEDGALPDGAVPALGKGATNSPVLVVSVPDTDEGPPPQGVSEVEGAAEGFVGGGVQGDREREAAVEGARALRRSEV